MHRGAGQGERVVRALPSKVRHGKQQRRAARGLRASLIGCAHRVPRVRIRWPPRARPPGSSSPARSSRSASPFCSSSRFARSGASERSCMLCSVSAGAFVWALRALLLEFRLCFRLFLFLFLVAAASQGIQPQRDEPAVPRGCEPQALRDLQCDLHRSQLLPARRVHHLRVLHRHLRHPGTLVLACCGVAFGDAFGMQLLCVRKDLKADRGRCVQLHCLTVHRF